jgi:ADP-heptose:LPS heptosyltransferase
MQLIPQPLLEKADKVLFIAHLAIGDFTYLQSCFKAFAEAYPHLKIHIWIDEVRRTSDESKWGYLKNYALYDWAEACPFFAKVYRRTYSPALLAESITEARAENYQLVVSLATLRPQQYARLARACGPRARVIGMPVKPRWYAPADWLAGNKLDAVFAPFAAFDGYHITDVYADWFRQLSGLQMSPAQRFPYMDVAPEWQTYAKVQLSEWGVVSGADGKRCAPLVFINPFAKTKKRCWPVSKVADLILELQQRAEWRDAHFIINATPQEIEQAKGAIADRLPPRTQWFTAQKNFFQLPAILQSCDLIISVETAVMHLANAVHVPVVALMRRKNPEWVPFDRKNSKVIMAARRSDWVDAIPVQYVVEAL